MKLWIILFAVAVLMGLTFSACEVNGARTSHGIAKQIIGAADRLCAERGKTANIAWMEGRIDDVVVTCQDGTNHYYDG